MRVAADCSSALEAALFPSGPPSRAPSSRAGLQRFARQHPGQLLQCPGPLWSVRVDGGMPLSHYVWPARGDGDLAAAILYLSLHYPALGQSAELPHFIARWQECGAGRNAIVASIAAPDLSGQDSILLIDQVADMPAGLAGPVARDAWQRMVDACLSENPGKRVLLWSPSGGQLCARVRLPAQIECLPRHCALAHVLPYCSMAYTIAAPEGLDVLLAGLPLRVFGQPFYAGWGLTRDEPGVVQHSVHLSPEALLEAVCLHFSRYVDPLSLGEGCWRQVMELIDLQSNMRQRFADLHTVSGVRFQIWKRPFATPFLLAGGGQLRWTNKPSRLYPKQWAVVWGGKSKQGIPAANPVLYMEDGFIHSLGLGSDMVAPRSQVLDRQGLYFDASRPNELTAILNDADFSAHELQRASELRRLIVAAGLTKYNLGRRAPDWQAPPGRTVALVIGQVADDASIRLGTTTINTAEQLLQEVRQRFPQVFIVYKPHPDVLSGNRQGLVDALALADRVDARADVLSLIDCADQIHTLSSLAGFDALLRGKPVFTYGLPFYAGWGLTTDVVPTPEWRRRRLTLDMLVAGVLLRYPLYWDWQLKLFTMPEAVVAQLAPGAGRALPEMMSARRRLAGKVVRWLRNAYDHLVWQRRQRRIMSRA